MGGLLAGMFGVGGGILMVPLLMLWAHMDQRRAAATSLVAIVPTAIAGATTYGIAGEIDLIAALLVGAGRSRAHPSAPTSFERCRSRGCAGRSSSACSSRQHD